MHAFRNGHLAIAEMLVARGADVDAKNKVSLKIEKSRRVDVRKRELPHIMLCHISFPRYRHHQLRSSLFLNLI